MAELQGSAAKAAFKQAGTWGTAVALGDGDQVEYASESIVPDAQLVDSDQITGEALAGPSDVGSIIVQGELAGMDLKYSGHERFFRMVFGAATGEGTADGAGWKHSYDFLQSNEGQFGTLAFEKVVDAGTHTIHEIDSWKPMGLTFNGQPGQPVKLTVRGIGHKLQPGESATNVASTTWSLPGKGGAPETRRVVKFGQCVIEVAEVTGGVVGAFSSLCASAFTISLQRNGDPVPTTCSGDYADEPSTDTVEITGQLDFPIYNDDNHFLVEANIAKSKLSLRFTFTSPDTYDTNKPYKIVLHVPGVQLTSGYPNVNTKGRVPLSVQWRAYNAPVGEAVDTDAVMPRLYVFNDTEDPDDYSNA